MTKDIVNLFPHIGCFGSVTIRNIHMAWLWTAESVGLPNVMHIMMISSWSQQKNYIDSAQEGFAILSKPILGRGLKTTTSNISILLACLQQDQCGTTSFVGCPRMMSGTYGCGYIDLSQYALTLNGSCVWTARSNVLECFYPRTLNEQNDYYFFAKAYYCAGSVSVSNCRWTDGTLKFKSNLIRPDYSDFTRTTLLKGKFLAAIFYKPYFCGVSIQKYTTEPSDS